MKDYTIFVISINKERQKKYIDPRYTIFQGVNGKEELDIDWINETYNFYWNAGDKIKYSIAGCSESHIKCMEHIRDNKINNAIVIEDDALLDLNRLEELDEIDDFCYIGGRFVHYKNINKIIDKNKIRDKLNKGINKIDEKIFNILNFHGYYIPKYELVDKLLIKQYTKRRAIDVEFKLQQRKKIITDFIYPAISILHLPDAKNGFTYCSYKLEDNLYRY